MTGSRRRYYQTPPDEMPLEQCTSHGDFHGSIGWGQQVDPRWSPEQVTAYIDAWRLGNLLWREENVIG